jgi:hypothetical protein
MMPLIITHYLIDYLYNANQKSQRELVDAEKAKKIKILDEEMIDTNASKEYITNKIKEKDDAIKVNTDRILNLEKEMNNCLNQTENRYAEVMRPIKNIFDDFNTKIISGKIFTHEILHSVISAFKSGFIDYLPTYYSEDEVANRVGKLDQVIATNNN